MPQANQVLMTSKTEEFLSGRAAISLQSDVALSQVLNIIRGQEEVSPFSTPPGNIARRHLGCEKKGTWSVAGFVPSFLQSRTLGTQTALGELVTSTYLTPPILLEDDQGLISKYLLQLSGPFTPNY